VGTLLDVALASCVTLPEADPDQVLLLEALRARGLQAEVWAWDDPTRDWATARRVVLRSTWNYVHHAAAFLAWAEHVAEVSVLDNPAEVVRWNWHKGYLGELAARGVPVTPTQLVRRGDPRGLDAIAGDWDEVVVKPAVSAGSFATLRARRGAPSWDVAAAQLRRLLGERDMLVQAFLPAVEGHGERALVHIDGMLTHAVRKQPRFAGDAESVSAAVAAQPEEAALAARVLAAASAALGLPAEQRLLYARCDVAPGPMGDPVLMELELIEPSLFLAEAPAALDRLVRAIEARLQGCTGDGRARG